MNSILNEAKIINKINDNSYFKNLNKDTINNFVLSQIDFVRAVSKWSGVLGFMIDKLDVVQRMVIIRNLYDEHGNGDLSKAHVATFLEFIHKVAKLSSIQLPIQLTTKQSLPIDNFINKLDHIVRNENWQTAIAALGMIEYAYVNVSNLIYNYISLFMPTYEIPHYSIHEILDIDHAEEMFSLLINEDQTIIHNGMQLGYDALNNLYSELFIEFFVQQQPENKNEIYRQDNQ